MKKNVVKSLFILVLGIFLLVPGSVNASSWEAEWKYDVDLSNSISSSIAKLEDGIAFMKYEGSASDGNVIIKFSNDGEVVKTIKNEYGYQMSEYDGGLLLYTPNSAVCNLTKLDKDLNVVWSIKSNTEAPDYMIDLNQGFATADGDTLYTFDDDGNFLKQERLTAYHYTLYNEDYWFYSMAYNKSLDGNNIVVLAEAMTNSWSSSDATDGIAILVLSKDLEVVESYKVDLDQYRDYRFNDVIETDDSFILSGFKTIALSKDGKVETQLNTVTYNAAYLNKKVYSYTFNSKDVEYSYDTFISEYTSKLKLLGSSKLPRSVENLDFTNTTGFATLKNRAVFYDDDGSVKVVILDAPIVPDEKYDGYSVTQYEVKVPTDDKPKDDGVITNIVKNPQTDSVVVIIAFVIVIIVVSIICYFFYKRKSVSKK